MPVPMAVAVAVLAAAAQGAVLVGRVVRLAAATLALRVGVRVLVAPVVVPGLARLPAAVVRQELERRPTAVVPIVLERRVPQVPGQQAMPAPRLAQAIPAPRQVVVVAAVVLRPVMLVREVVVLQVLQAMPVAAPAAHKQQVVVRPVRPAPIMPEQLRLGLRVPITQVVELRVRLVLRVPTMPGPVRLVPLVLQVPTTPVLGPPVVVVVRPMPEPGLRVRRVMLLRTRVAVVVPVVTTTWGRVVRRPVGRPVMRPTVVPVTAVTVALRPVVVGPGQPLVARVVLVEPVVPVAPIMPVQARVVSVVDRQPAATAVLARHPRQARPALAVAL